VPWSNINMMSVKMTKKESVLSHAIVSIILHYPDCNMCSFQEA
jgi:hypothetical protein